MVGRGVIEMERGSIPTRKEMKLIKTVLTKYGITGIKHDLPMGYTVFNPMTEMDYTHWQNNTFWEAEDRR